MFVLVLRRPARHKSLVAEPRSTARGRRAASVPLDDVAFDQRLPRDEDRAAIADPVPRNDLRIAPGHSRDRAGLASGRPVICEIERGTRMLVRGESRIARTHRRSLAQVARFPLSEIAGEDASVTGALTVNVM